MVNEPPGFDDLYPFTSHYLDVGGPWMHYVDEGTGSPVVMLHGNPTWSFYYRELIRGLRDDHRVIAPDHIGCGLSDKPQEYDYTLSTHIDNLGRLLDHLGLDDVTLVVHDWGGAIGFGWAMRYPQHVRRLVIFNTAAFPGPCPWRIRICRWPVFGEVVLRGLNGFARAAVRMACKNRKRMTVRVKRAYLWPYDSYANRIATLWFVRDIPLKRSQASYRVLAEIDASLSQFRDRPSLICWGARDFCFNDWFLSEWKTRFPQAEVHRFEDAGHYVVEDASDRILPLMKTFLAKSELSDRPDPIRS